MSRMKEKPQMTQIAADWRNKKSHLRPSAKSAVQQILPEPEFRHTDGFVTTIWRSKTGQVTDPVTPPVAGQVTGQAAGQVNLWTLQALRVCAEKPLSSREIQESIGLRHRETFQRNYLDQMISEGLLERTIPGKPTSRLQKYRLTAKGRALLEPLDKEGGKG